MENIERRYYKRALTGNERTVSGYAALFNVETRLFKGVSEVIAPGAFRNAIPQSDIVLLLNHDANHVMGRVRSGTLKVWEDEEGLPFDGTLPVSRADVIELLNRGDLDQCSFAFTIKTYEKVERENDTLYRITEVDRLYDVSIVTYPAYKQTNVSLNGDYSQDVSKRYMSEIQKELSIRATRPYSHIARIKQLQ